MYSLFLVIVASREVVSCAAVDATVSRTEPTLDTVRALIVTSTVPPFDGSACPHPARPWASAQSRIAARGGKRWLGVGWHPFIRCQMVSPRSSRVRHSFATCWIDREVRAIG